MSSGQEIFYICLFHAIRTIQDMADVLVRSRSTIFPKTPVSTMTRITRKFGLQNDILNLPKGILSKLSIDFAILIPGAYFRAVFDD